MFHALIARAREARALEFEGGGAGEGGFTLIELMVVLLIIAILLAIAIPTFLGVTGSAKDRSAQSQLTNVVTEAVATYQNSQTYPASSTIGNYSSGDPQFTWVDGNAATPTKCTTANTKCVSVANVDVANAADAQGVILAVMASTGTCWYAVNLQAQPVAAFTGGDTGTGATEQFVLPTTGAQTPGTFYAKSTPSGGGKTAKACDAGAAASGFSWGNNYGAAPDQTS